MSPESSRPNQENPNTDRQTTIQVAREIALKKITKGNLAESIIARKWVNELFDDLKSVEPKDKPEVVSFDLRPINEGLYKHFSKIKEAAPKALELAKDAVLHTLLDLKYPIPSELTLGVAIQERSRLSPVKTEQSRMIVEINTLIPGVILKYFFTDDRDKTLVGGRELIISPLNSSL
jgi:hypothetical protein